MDHLLKLQECILLQKQRNLEVALEVCLEWHFWRSSRLQKRQRGQLRLQPVGHPLLAEAEVVEHCHRRLLETRHHVNQKKVAPYRNLECLYPRGATVRPAQPGIAMARPLKGRSGSGLPGEQRIAARRSLLGARRLHRSPLLVEVFPPLLLGELTALRSLASRGQRVLKDLQLQLLNLSLMFLLVLSWQI